MDNTRKQETEKQIQQIGNHFPAHMDGNHKQESGKQIQQITPVIISQHAWTAIVNKALENKYLSTYI